ncbi:MAG: alpha/beta hydrolase [Chitinophagaceae bacterium]|nr:alpha/beta hydrolase [Chitinophagaceae bacterium]
MKRIFISLLFANGSFFTDAQVCNSGNLDPRVATALRSKLFDLSAPSTTSVEKIRDVKIKSPAFPKADVQYIKITGDSIPVQVYNPAHTTNMPIIISYHAGGFVTPILPFMEYEFWREAKVYNAIVFAVDYRIAPEHKYPAAVNDVYNAFKWIAENGEKFGGDTGRIVILGSSAGGNLAAVVSQKARQEGIAHKIKLLALNCPSTDNPGNSGKHPSYQQYASGYFLTKEFCQYYISVYAPDENTNNPEVGPLNGKDLSGLPPAVIITAEFDPVRDEGAEYAQRLKDAGVRVWYKCFPGQIHCLLGLPPGAKELMKVDEMILKAMKEVLY